VQFWTTNFLNNVIDSDVDIAAGTGQFFSMSGDITCLFSGDA
jgi:hypothetical protein